MSSGRCSGLARNHVKHKLGHRISSSPRRNKAVVERWLLSCPRFYRNKWEFRFTLLFRIILDWLDQAFMLQLQLFVALLQFVNWTQMTNLWLEFVSPNGTWWMSWPPHHWRTSCQLVRLSVNTLLAKHFNIWASFSAAVDRAVSPSCRPGADQSAKTELTQ